MLYLKFVGLIKGVPGSDKPTSVYLTYLDSNIVLLYLNVPIVDPGAPNVVSDLNTKTSSKSFELFGPEIKLLAIQYYPHSYGIFYFKYLFYLTVTRLDFLTQSIDYFDFPAVFFDCL